MVSNEKEIPQDKKHQEEGKKREEGCAPLTPAKFKVFFRWRGRRREKASQISSRQIVKVSNAGCFRELRESSLC